jgi:hypothetical protein
VPLRAAPHRHILKVASELASRSDPSARSPLEVPNWLKPKAHRAKRHFRPAGAPSKKGFDRCQICLQKRHRSQEAHKCVDPGNCWAKRGISRPSTRSHPKCPECPLKIHEPAHRRPLECHLDLALRGDKKGLLRQKMKMPPRSARSGWHLLKKGALGHNLASPATPSAPDRAGELMKMGTSTCSPATRSAQGRRKGAHRCAQNATLRHKIN